MRFFVTPALLAALLLLLALLGGCRGKSGSETAATAPPTARPPGPTDTAIVSPPDGITAAAIGRHIQVLASDAFQGRKPFTVGEEKTTAYLADEFRKLGLKPGNEGSFFQEVPLVEITGQPTAPLTISGPGQKLTLDFKTDFMAFTEREVPAVRLQNSELVFAGYGIVAPEYHWNDYAGLDVKGKTVVVLVNDPGYASGDSALFKGRAMTYYGRWMYKYEEAARQGAAGLLIIHDTPPAAYPWSVVQTSYSGAKLRPQTADQGASKAAVEGWLTLDAAKRMFRAAGQNYDQLYAAAGQPGFRAVPLGLRASTRIENTLRRRTSKNVVALLPGTARANEYVLYSAHWDHLGIGPAVNGDSIYNGALDNASGCAGLLAIARAFMRLPQRPARSVVFLAVTGEEQGLLGSAYYAAHPVFSLGQTVADLNMDNLGAYGPMRDVTVVGYGQSDLDDYARAAAQKQNRYLQPDPEAEKGYYYRSDHFSFAKVGVPSLYASGAADSRARGKDYIRQQHQEFESKHYHQPSDEYNPGWDLRGMEQDARLLFAIGRQLANESTFPNWKPGSEFRAVRDQSRGAKPRA